MKESRYFQSICLLVFIFSLSFQKVLICMMPSGNIPDIPGSAMPTALPSMDSSATSFMMPGAMPPGGGMPLEFPAADTSLTQTTQMPLDTLPEPEMAPPAGPETTEFSDDEIGTQGNWVKKREWLKEAGNVNNQIQELVVSIQKSRKTFYDRFNEIDKDLDDFYKQEGFEQGKAQALFDQIENYLEKKKKRAIVVLKAEGEGGVTGELEIKIDIVEEEIKDQKRELEQLKLDVKSIEDLDTSVGQRLKKLDEQINVALQESSNAKKVSDKIWYMIDDKKARTAFYQLKGNILEKIKSIQDYIQQDLSADFDKVLGVVKTQISKVKEGVRGLEDKGIIIRNRAKRLEEIKLQEFERSEAEKAAQLAAQETKAEEEIEEKIGFFAGIYNSVVNGVANTYLMVKKLFGA